MIIRSKTLRQWVGANFDKGYLEDIVNHGASAGFPGLTYYTDTVKLYERFHIEIWEMVCDWADQTGQTPLQAIAEFDGQDNAVCHVTFANLLVWFAVEEIARELIENDDD